MKFTNKPQNKKGSPQKLIPPSPEANFFFPALLNKAYFFECAQDTTRNSAQEPENQFFQAFPVCFLTISFVRE